MSRQSIAEPSDTSLRRAECKPPAQVIRPFSGIGRGRTRSLKFFQEFASDHAQGPLAGERRPVPSRIAYKHGGRVRDSKHLEPFIKGTATLSPKSP